MADNAAAHLDDDESTTEPDREVHWRGSGVGLSALDVDDAELLHTWRSDPVAGFEIGIWPQPLSRLRDRVERDVADHERDDFLVLLPDGTPVGHIALVDQDIVDGTAEIVLLLDPRHRGRGHGAGAVDALVDMAFGELPMHRLEAVTHTTNAPALATLAKSGFTQEGIRRSACLHRGTRHDVAVWSLLRPEWQSLPRPKSWDLNPGAHLLH
ncbi:GNAT family N-acetyltransferase [Streptomyces sp. NBC_01190]|uniref:GNAT family N-acetyltransferase n=1 Tax=Streptomyces sp. NBC_01190 TaxID=2903767 RepID=UPI00386DB839|nr:GNAT family N-acetyltransferase [Streptomyces sp. NBC_01190]